MLRPVTVLLGVEARLRRTRLLFATDARPPSGDLESLASAAIAGGAGMIALVDDALDARGQLDALEALRRAGERQQVLVAVYNDADVAGEFAADVLLLPDDGSSAKKARRALHENALIGRSCRGEADIDAAVADPDVNFFVVDSDAATVGYAAKAAPPSNPDAKPWFAAGGITPGNVDEALGAGARRVMVSRAIERAGDPQAAASALDERLAKAWQGADMEAAIFGHPGRPVMSAEEAFPGLAGTGGSVGGSGGGGTRGSGSTRAEDS